MFAATLQELASQLSVLQPPQPERSGQPPRGGGDDASGPAQLLQRLLAPQPGGQPGSPPLALPHVQLPPEPLQRALPEQVDENLRLLNVLAAEMRRFVRRLQQLADGATAAALAGGFDLGGASSDAQQGGCGAGLGDEALLLAAAVDGTSREMQLIVSGQGCVGVPVGTGWLQACSAAG